jgi:uncharacterized membrane-anchored protein YjiN (DUF445 family)
MKTPFLFNAGTNGDWSEKSTIRENTEMEQRITKQLESEVEAEIKDKLTRAIKEQIICANEDEIARFIEQEMGAELELERTRKYLFKDFIQWQ